MIALAGIVVGLLVLGIVGEIALRRGRKEDRDDGYQLTNSPSTHLFFELEWAYENREWDYYDFVFDLLRRRGEFA